MKTSDKPKREYAGHGEIQEICEPKPFMAPPSLDDLIIKDSGPIVPEMEDMVENVVSGLTDTLRVNSANKLTKQAANEESAKKGNETA